MHAYLLTAPGTVNFQLTIDNLAAQINARELPFVLQKIEDTRELKKLVSLSFNQKTAIIIENFDLATNEAQNAFLKNLEEPQQNIFYILTATNLNNILPTITSRCSLIKIRGGNNFDICEGTVNFSEGDINYRLDYISKIRKREEAIQLVEELIGLNHNNKNFKQGEIFLNALRNLKANGNVTLQLTNLVVMLDS